MSQLLTLRRNVLAPNRQRRVGPAPNCPVAVLAAPSCPIPMYRQHCTRLKWINIAVLIKRANTMAYAPKGHLSIWSIGNMVDLRWLVVGYTIRDAGWCRIGEIIVRGWRREAGTWFQWRREAYWKERSVIRREDDVDGRASVTKDEERVLRGGWTVMRLCRYDLCSPAMHLMSIYSSHAH